MEGFYLQLREVHLTFNSTVATTGAPDVVAVPSGPCNLTQTDVGEYSYTSPNYPSVHRGPLSCSVQLSSVRTSIRPHEHIWTEVINL